MKCCYFSFKQFFWLGSLDIVSTPLVEAFCIFEFADIAWNWNIPNQFHEIIKNQFPRKEEHRDMILRPADDPDGPPLNYPDRIKFFNESNNKMIQVGPNRFAINLINLHLNENIYFGWDNFKAFIEESLNIYLSLFNYRWRISWVLLQFINRIPISERKNLAGELDLLSDFILNVPNAKDICENPLQSFNHQYEFEFKDIDGSLLYKIGTMFGHDTNYLGLDLLFKIFRLQHKYDQEDILLVLDKAHYEIKKAFINSLSKKFLDIIGLQKI